MIKLQSEGVYKLIETKSATKVLDLGREMVYAWVMAGEIGEILVNTNKPHRVDHVLAIGNYKIYKVEEEKDWIDGIHLELEVGQGIWQGYLLLTGLPGEEKIRSRIVPTKELIAVRKDLKGSHP